METGFHIGTKVEKGGVEAISYALVDMLGIYAGVVEKAISVLREMSAASPVSNCSFNNCYVGDGGSTPPQTSSSESIYRGLDSNNLPWAYQDDVPEDDEDELPPEEYTPSVYNTSDDFVDSLSDYIDPVSEGFRRWAEDDDSFVPRD